MSEVIDSEIETLDQILLSRSFKPEDVAKDIDAEIESLDLLLAQRQQPGFLENAVTGTMNAIGEVGKFVDTYSGAPTRAAIGEVVQGNFSNAPGAFIDQFGNDPANAPTGKEIAQVAGFSDQSLGTIPASAGRNETQDRILGTSGPLSKPMELPSPAGAVGFGVDVAADPLNFIPLGAVAKTALKGGSKAAKETTKFALKGSVAALDAATGTEIISKSSDTIGKYINRVVESTKGRFNPSQAPDFESFTEIAAKNGIDPAILPESVEFGPQSTITKKSKVAAEGPGGESIQTRYIKAQGEVENALDNQIKNYSGGESLSNADAGNMLLDSYNNGIKSFFDQDILTYDKVISKNPGMLFDRSSVDAIQSKMKGLSNKATGRLRRGFGDQPAQAKQVLNDIETLKRSFDKNGNISLKQATEALRNIGEEAFKKVPPGQKTAIDQKALQELYHELRNGIHQSTASVMGPEAAKELATNNQLISNFIGEKSQLAKIFSGDVAPEKVFKRLADSGDTKQLNALKEVISPEDFNRFKGVYLNNLIIRGADGSPLYKSTMKNLARKQDAISILFKKDEVRSFADILRLGDRVGDFVFNTSNTNTAIRFAPKEWLGEIIAGGTDELTLEKLKEVARRKNNTPLQITTETGQKVSVRPSMAKTAIKQIPLINSKRSQVIEVGKVGSIQETNKEIERRKRATAGEKSNR